MESQEKSFFERRNERKVERAVLRSSKFAAEYIYSTFPRGEELVARINIGTSPKSLTDEEFLEKVGARTIALLNNRTHIEIAQYDHELSLWSTDEVKTIDPGSKRASVRAVFINQFVCTQDGNSTSPPSLTD